MAILISVDGTETETQPASSKEFSLEELQGFVGGYIEIVRTKDGKAMIINEEGKLKGLEANPAATKLVELFAGDYIAGPALVVEEEEIS